MEIAIFPLSVAILQIFSVEMSMTSALSFIMSQCQIWICHTMENPNWDFIFDDNSISHNFREIRSKDVHDLDLDL